MCGKIIKGLKLLHLSLTFLSFSSKANINEVKWILYKGKAVVGWEDQPFLNQTSITSVGFSFKIRDCRTIVPILNDCTNLIKINPQF